MASTRECFPPGPYWEDIYIGHAGALRLRLQIHPRTHEDLSGPRHPVETFARAPRSASIVTSGFCSGYFRSTHSHLIDVDQSGLPVQLELSLSRCVANNTLATARLTQPYNVKLAYAERFRDPLDHARNKPAFKQRTWTASRAILFLQSIAHRRPCSAKSSTGILSKKAPSVPARLASTARFCRENSE
jgi:hypothetical protein